MLAQSPQGFKQAQPVSLVNEANDATGSLLQGPGTIVTEKVPISLDPSTSPPHSLKGLPRPPTHQHSISTTSNSQDAMSSRQNSLDTFYDLARVPSHPKSGTSNDGNDSGGGDAEIDFESLWQWPNSNGTGLTPGGIAITPGGSIGIVGGMQPAFSTMNDVQGISDSSVPLFGLSTGEFGVV
jgi:hypothetical protein